MFNNLLGLGKKKRTDECYYDEDGAVVRFEGSGHKHDGPAEYAFVMAQNNRPMGAGDVVYIIDAVWLQKWSEFCTQEEIHTATQGNVTDTTIPPVSTHTSSSSHRASDLFSRSHGIRHREDEDRSRSKLLISPPGRISNHRLVTEATVVETYLRDGQPQYTFRGDLHVKEHFRPVHRYIWEYLFQKYGGGPVIMFYIPQGCTEKQYRKGTWIKEVASVIPAIVNIIPTSHIPKKRNSINLTEPILEGERRWADAEAADAEAKKQQEEAMRVRALEKEQVRLAAASIQLDTEIQQEQARIVLQNVFVSSQINHTLEQAQETEREKLQTVMGDIATVFQLGNETKKAQSLRDLRPEDRTAAQTRELWDACARVIQIRYRSRMSQRKVQKLKQEAYELKLEGYARKLQSFWRIRQAKKCVALKAEQRRTLRRIKSAVMVQCLWRKRKARVYLTALREARIAQRLLEAETERKRRAVVIICTLMRGLLARLRVRRLVMLDRLHSIHVVIHSGHSLISAGSLATGILSTTDPYVRVVGSRLKLHPGQTAAQSTSTVVSHAKGSNNKGASRGKGVVQTVCMGVTKPAFNTCNPTWEQEVLLSGMMGNDSIVLNVYDRDKFNMKLGATDKFLGQAEICLSDYPDLFHSIYGIGIGSMQRGCVVDLPEVPLTSSISTIHNDKGEVIGAPDVLDVGGSSTSGASGTGTGGLGSLLTIAANTVAAGIGSSGSSTSSKTNKKSQSRGSLHVTLKVTSAYRSMCGWMYKYSSSAVVGMPRSYKRRWMVLSDESLQYYDDLYSLHDPRYTVVCKDISLIELTMDEKTGVVDTIQLAFGRDSWQLKFCEEDNQRKRDLWVRRIQQCCINLGYRSKDTASRLAAYPVLHGVRQLVNRTLLNPDNIDVTNLPYAPENNTNNNTTTGAAGGSGRGGGGVGSSGNIKVSSGVVSSSTGPGITVVTPQRRRSSGGPASTSTSNSGIINTNNNSISGDTDTAGSNQRTRSRTSSNTSDITSTVTADSITASKTTKRRSSFLNDVLLRS